MANQSTFQVPFPWIQGLEAVPRDQIRRNFEELTAALDSIPSVYVVVADDGSGDYTSIKEAIEASPNGVSNESGTAIWVKPGTYDDGGAGAVNLNGPKRVWVFAAPPPHFGLSAATQAWTFDGFSCTSGTAHVTLTGIAPTSGALEDWLSGGGTIYLHMDRVRGGSGRGVFGSSGSHHFRATDCELSSIVLFTASTGATVPASVICDNSDISITTAASTPPVLTSLGLFRIIGGDISHQAALTASNSVGSGGEFIIADAHLSGGGTITSAFDIFTLTGVTTDEDTTTVDFSIDGVSGSRFALVAMSGNAMHGCDLTFGNNCRVSCHGAYRTLTIGTTAGSYFVELDNVSASTCISIVNTSGGGDSNFVVASLRQVGGGSSRNVSIAASCNDNKVYYTVSGTAALGDSDSGTGNSINAFPPSGAAGGDLSGTYPNPSVQDDSHSHTAGTLPATIVYDGDAAGGDLSGTYPNPSVVDDSHSHTTATLPATMPPRNFVDTTVGDGVSTSIAITHSLGTEAVIVSVVQNADDLEVYPDVVITSTTVVTLNFTVAPATDALRVTVIG